MIKRPKIQGDIIIVNICAFNNSVPKIMTKKLTEVKKEIDNSTTARNFNTTLSVTDRITSQETNKEIEDLSSILNQLDLTDVCRTLHRTRAEYIFFSSAPTVFWKIDYARL